MYESNFKRIINLKDQKIERIGVTRHDDEMLVISKDENKINDPTHPATNFKCESGCTTAPHTQYKHRHHHQNTHNFFLIKI